jgi:hypothetical protein
MLSPDMGTSYGQPGHPIFPHVIPFSGGIWNPKFSKFQHLHTVQELKHGIQEEVERIPIEMLQGVMSDFRKRLTECLKENGGHLTDVTFRN